MSSEETTCPSKAYVQDELTHCQLAAGHTGVHLGKIHLSEGADMTGVELVQWRDGDAASDTEPVDDVPVWYAVLPLGKTVRVTYRDTLDQLDAEVVGAVLDDHEQPGALVIAYDDRRALVPWANVAALSWEQEK